MASSNEEDYNEKGERIREGDAPRVAKAFLLTEVETDDTVELEVNLEGDDPFGDLVVGSIAKEPIFQSVRFRMLLINVVVLLLGFVMSEANIGIDDGTIRDFAELITLAIISYIIARSVRNVPNK